MTDPLRETPARTTCPRCSRNVRAKHDGSPAKHNRINTFTTVRDGQIVDDHDLRPCEQATDD